MNHRFTGSKTLLATLCQYWLRDDVQLVDRVSGVESVEGTAFHKCAELRLLGRTPDVRQVCESVGIEARRVLSLYSTWLDWLSSNIEPSWVPEVIFALDPMSGAVEEVRDCDHRDYSWVHTDHVPMQVDVVSIGEDWDGPYATVIDWKTGKRSSSHYWQLLTAAVAVSRARKLDRVLARAVYVSEASVDEELWWLSKTELDAHESRLRRIKSNKEASPRVGDHCHEQYCQAMSVCPAKTAMVRSMAGHIVNVADKFAMMTPEDEAIAWLNYEKIKPLFYEVEGLLKGVAKARGIELPDGRKVRAVESERASFSKEKATKLLEELGASEEQIQSCMVSASVTSVRALGKKKTKNEATTVIDMMGEPVDESAA